MADWSGLHAIHVVLRVIDLLQEAKYYDLVSNNKKYVLKQWLFVSKILSIDNRNNSHFDVHKKEEMLQ